MERKIIIYICSVLFSLFCFCYLYFYQANILQLIQRIASDEQTYYQPWIGAIVITITLQLLQIGINYIVKLSKRGFALTYFPSILILTILTSINSDTTNLSIGNWTWLAPILTLIFIIVIIYVKKYEPYEPTIRSNGIFSQISWINIGTLTLLLFFIAIFTNGDYHFHQRAKLESLVNDKDYKGALLTAKSMEYTDSVSSMLTIYALARQQQLPESLFYYKIIGGNEVLRPNNKVHSILIPDGVIIKSTQQSIHYQLSGFLLGKNREKFMKYLPIYYPVDSLRPRYYKEAFHLFKMIEHGIKPRRPYAIGSYTKYYFS